MSLLVKKLEQATGGAGQPIGFGAASRGKSPPMVLVACLSQVEPELVRLAVSGKVDALLFDLEDPASQAERIPETIPSDNRVPWGVRLPKADGEGLDKFAEAGCDYILFSHESAAHVLAEERMGKVLEVDVSLQDGIARAVGQLSIEAVVLSDTSQLGAISVSQVANYGRIVSYVNKPALAYLPAEVSELAPLRYAGIAGTIMNFRGKDLEERVKAVQEVIDGLASARKKSRKGSYAFVPSISISGDEYQSDY